MFRKALRTNLVFWVSFIIFSRVAFSLFTFLQSEDLVIPQRRSNRLDSECTESPIIMQLAADSTPEATNQSAEEPYLHALVTQEQAVGIMNDFLAMDLSPVADEPFQYAINRWISRLPENAYTSLMIGTFDDKLYLRIYGSYKSGDGHYYVKDVGKLGYYQIEFNVPNDVFSEISAELKRLQNIYGFLNGSEELLKLWDTIKETEGIKLDRIIEAPWDYYVWYDFTPTQEEINEYFNGVSYDWYLEKSIYEPKDFPYDKLDNAVFKSSYMDNRFMMWLFDRNTSETLWGGGFNSPDEYKSPRPEGYDLFPLVSQLKNVKVTEPIVDLRDSDAQIDFSEAEIIVDDLIWMGLFDESMLKKAFDWVRDTGRLNSPWPCNEYKIDFTIGTNNDNVYIEMEGVLHAVNASYSRIYGKTTVEFNVSKKFRKEVQSRLESIQGETNVQRRVHEMFSLWNDIRKQTRIKIKTIYLGDISENPYLLRCMKEGHEDIERLKGVIDSILSMDMSTFAKDKIRHAFNFVEEFLRGGSDARKMVVGTLKDKVYLGIYDVSRVPSGDDVNVNGYLHDLDSKVNIIKGGMLMFDVPTKVLLEFQDKLRNCPSGVGNPAEKTQYLIDLIKGLKDIEGVKVDALEYKEEGSSFPVYFYDFNPTRGEVKDYFDQVVFNPGVPWYYFRNDPEWKAWKDYYDQVRDEIKSDFPYHKLKDGNNIFSMTYHRYTPIPTKFGLSNPDTEDTLWSYQYPFKEEPLTYNPIDNIYKLPKFDDAKITVLDAMQILTGNSLGDGKGIDDIPAVDCDVAKDVIWQGWNWLAGIYNQYVAPNYTSGDYPETPLDVGFHIGLSTDKNLVLGIQVIDTSGNSSFLGYFSVYFKVPDSLYEQVKTELESLEEKFSWANYKGTEEERNEEISQAYLDLWSRVRETEGVTLDTIWHYDSWNTYHHYDFTPTKREVNAYILERLDFPYNMLGSYIWVEDFNGFASIYKLITRGGEVIWLSE
jgi:hypothetical protein